MYTKIYVLGITIASFDDKTITSLPFSLCLEAEKIHAEILNLVKVNGEEPRIEVEFTHLGKGGKRVTKKDIVEAIGDISLKARRTDALIVYILTHGLMDDHKYYLALSDSSRKTKASQISTMFDSDEIVAIINTIPTITKLVLLNTCNAGGILHSSRLADFFREHSKKMESGVHTVPQWPLATWGLDNAIDDSVARPGLQLICAASANQKSHFDVESGTTYFFDAILATFGKAKAKKLLVWDLQKYSNFLQRHVDRKTRTDADCADRIFIQAINLKNGKVVVPIMENFPMWLDTKNTTYSWSTDVFKLDLLLSGLRKPSPQLIWELESFSLALKLRGSRYLEEISKTEIADARKARFLEPGWRVVTYAQAVKLAVLVGYKYVSSFDMSDPVYHAMCESLLASVLVLSFFFGFRVAFCEELKCVAIKSLFSSSASNTKKIEEGIQELSAHEKIFASVKDSNVKYDFLLALQDKYLNEKREYSWALLERATSEWTSERGFNLLNFLPASESVNITVLKKSLLHYVKGAVCEPTELITFFERVTPLLSASTAKELLGFSSMNHPRLVAQKVLLNTASKSTKVASRNSSIESTTVLTTSQYENGDRDVSFIPATPASKSMPPPKAPKKGKENKDTNTASSSTRRGKASTKTETKAEPTDGEEKETTKAPSGRRGRTKQKETKEEELTEKSEMKDTKLKKKKGGVLSLAPPSISETPAIPETPSSPTIPATPTIPSTPTIPTTPEIPSDPSVPATPARSCTEFIPSTPAPSSSSTSESTPRSTPAAVPGSKTPAPDKRKEAVVVGTEAGKSLDASAKWAGVPLPTEEDIAEAAAAAEELDGDTTAAGDSLRAAAKASDQLNERTCVWVNLLAFQLAALIIKQADSAAQISRALHYFSLATEILSVLTVAFPREKNHFRGDWMPDLGNTNLQKAIVTLVYKKIFKDTQAPNNKKDDVNSRAEKIRQYFCAKQALPGALAIKDIYSKKF